MKPIILLEKCLVAVYAVHIVSEFITDTATVTICTMYPTGHSGAKWDCIGTHISQVGRLFAAMSIVHS